MTDNFYIKQNYNIDVLGWTEAFLNYDMSVHNNERIKFNAPGFFVSHSGHKIEKVQNVLKDLNLNYAHLYFNITTKAETFGEHIDNMNVWFWQCQGVTKWVVDETNEFILNPSDLIFVPAGMKHKVIPMSPRLGVSMSKE